MIQFRALCAGLLLMSHSAVALGDDWYFHYAPAIADSGSFNNPQGDSLPTVDGDVVIFNGRTEFLMPATPGFAAPDFGLLTSVPPIGFYYQSLSDYQAAYDALLRVIAEDVAKENANQSLPISGLIGAPGIASVPEPSSLILLGLGAAGLFLAVRRRRSVWRVGTDS